ncbi:MAG: hypothetical protein NZ869_01220 [Thermoanaerobaculum sp.]|nr:hypothetical protein [Thermoanaerobaculum sp.]
MQREAALLVRSWGRRKPLAEVSEEVENPFPRTGQVLRQWEDRQVASLVQGPWSHGAPEELYGFFLRTTHDHKARRVERVPTRP